MAYLAGEDEVESENSVAIVASLREFVQQPEKLDEDAARNLIQSSQELINQVAQAVNKSALG